MATENIPYRLAAGVRFRREPDGSAMLLVPEAIVSLSETAVMILELLDGNRTCEEIGDILAQSCEDPDDALRGDVRKLLDDLAAKGFLRR